MAIYDVTPKPLAPMSTVSDPTHAGAMLPRVALMDNFTLHFSSYELAQMTRRVTLHSTESRAHKLYDFRQS